MILLPSEALAAIALSFSSADEVVLPSVSSDRPKLALAPAHSGEECASALLWAARRWTWIYLDYVLAGRGRQPQAASLALWAALAAIFTLSFRPPRQP